MKKPRILALRDHLEPHRQRLLDHPLYTAIDGLDGLQLFMQHHVFAVWDFMSLLKTLQRRLTTVTVPWVPATDAACVRLVNEIVLAEESDDDGLGGFASHFELYYRAMQQASAETGLIDRFLASLRGGGEVETALQQAEVPEAVARFVLETMAVIQGEDICELAAVFTFGREDLLPSVFQRLVDQLNLEAAGRLEAFRYYLGRHIELDGDQHGPMAERMVITLCGDETARWERATLAAVRALEARLALWDGMYLAITQSPNRPRFAEAGLGT
jgi:hypothetical protein